MNVREPNPQRMRLFVELVQEKGRLDLIDDLVRADFRNHTVEPGQRADRDGVRDAMAAMHEAFSDLEITILHCIGDRDLVATHKAVRGRHTGLWFGVPPSGNLVEFRVMDVVRYRDGMWAEHWAVADTVSLVRQIGAVP